MFGLHPASALVAVAIFALLLKLAVNYFSGRRLLPGPTGALAAFFSGILLVNGLAHFFHGISGEQFPAPFAYLLGKGLYSNLSNVLWGFLNLVLGVYLFRAGNVTSDRRRSSVAFYSGVLAMGLLLSFIFSHR